MMKQLKITLVRSLISRPQTQRDTVHALGLRKMHQSVLLDDTPEVRGAVRKVSHLIACTEVEV